MNDVSIIVPAHNEGKRLDSCLAALTKMYPRAEIVVSEDGSSDNTIEIARRFNVVILHTRQRLGKWGGIKLGLEYCSQLYTVIIDADLAVSPSVFPSAVNMLISGAAVIVGNRISYNGPLHRMILGKSFHALVRLLYGLPYDTQTSFMAFQTDAVRRVLEPLEVSRFAHAVVFLDACRKRGLKIVQIPVAWSYYPESSVNLKRDIPLMLKDLLTQRF